MENTKVERRALRALAIAALAVLLAVGMAALASPQRALAEPATDLTFQVKTSGADKDVSAYLIFKAEINDQTNAASNVSWADSTMENTVKAFMGDAYKNWLTSKGLSDSAENALTYIAEQIAASPGLGSNYGTAVSADSFAGKLAAAIKALTATQTQTMTASAPASFTGLTEGYYLFYNDDVAPMFAPVGGNATDAHVKDPTYLVADKTVKDGDDWSKITDAGNGDVVTFRVTGQVPNGVPAADVSYHYNLTDELPVGLTLNDVSNVKVYALHGSTETQLDASYYTTTGTSGNTLKVNIANLYGDNMANKDVMRSTDDRVTSIIFEYTATVNSDAKTGTTYNENRAVISYGDGTEDGDTLATFARVASYELDIVKVDSKDASKKLADAKFTLKVKDTDKYVQANGTLGTTANTFTTDSSGKIAVSLIDAGTYVLTETAAPNEYSLPAVTETEITITATKDAQTGELTALAATTNNANIATPTSDVSSGKVEVTIKNDPKTVLPITGMTPNQLGTVIGVLLVAAGVVAIVIRTRRKTRA